MTPFEQALKLYGYETTDFEHDLTAHIVSGYVVCTPEAIAFARPVRRDWTPDRFCDISDVEPLESADCWFIWLLCGKLEVAARWLPCPLPWLGFARRGKAVKFLVVGQMNYGKSQRYAIPGLRSTGSGPPLSGSRYQGVRGAWGA